MRFLLGGLALLSAVILGGCTSYPLPKVGYEQSAAVTSDRTGGISLTSGAMGGAMGTTAVNTGGIFIPVNLGPSPDWLNFNREDQAIFVACLAEELGRLSILKIAPTQSGQSPQPDVALSIVFVSTIRYPNNDYVLQVTLDIQTPADRQSKQYRIRGLENEPGWMRFTGVGAATGKKKAAQKLLNAMIPDIEDAVRRLSVMESSPGMPSS